MPEYLSGKIRDGLWHQTRTGETELTGKLKLAHQNSRAVEYLASSQINKEDVAHKIASAGERVQQSREGFLQSLMECSVTQVK